VWVDPSDIGGSDNPLDNHNNDLYCIYTTRPIQSHGNNFVPCRWHDIANGFEDQITELSGYLYNAQKARSVMYENKMQDLFVIIACAQRKSLYCTDESLGEPEAANRLFAQEMETRIILAYSLHCLITSFPSRNFAWVVLLGMVKKE